MNVIIARKASKLHTDLEYLCYTIESLEKCCIMSGTIPALSKSSARFTALFSLHHRLKSLSNSILYTAGGVHANRKVTKQLTTNFIQFIAFSTHSDVPHGKTQFRPLCLPPSHSVLAAWILPLCAPTVKHSF